MSTVLSTLTLKRAACLTAAMIALSACATTETSTMDATPVATAPTEATTKTAEADDRMICKKTTVVGSKFNKRVCATAAQWEARAAVDREATENIQRAKAPGVTN